MHAYDCCVDYNPIAISERAVILWDHISLSTVVATGAPEPISRGTNKNDDMVPAPIGATDFVSTTFKIEARDGSVYIIDQSQKVLSRPRFLPLVNFRLSNITHKIFEKVGFAKSSVQLAALKSPPGKTWTSNRRIKFKN